MYMDVNTIITAASLLAAIGAIFSVVFAVYRWYLRQNRQDTEIEKLKLQLIHKDELLEQKEKELETLRKMISLLEKVK